MEQKAIYWKIFFPLRTLKPQLRASLVLKLDTYNKE